MSLLKDFAPPKRLHACKVRTIMASLEKADKDILKAAIDNPDIWPARSLQNALEVRGIQLSDLTINRHRKKVCSCVG